MFATGPKVADSNSAERCFGISMFVMGPKVRSTLVLKSLCFLESILKLK